MIPLSSHPRLLAITASVPDGSNYNARVRFTHTYDFLLGAKRVRSQHLGGKHHTHEGKKGRVPVLPCHETPKDVCHRQLLRGPWLRRMLLRLDPPMSPGMLLRAWGLR